MKPFIKLLSLITLLVFSYESYSTSNIYNSFLNYYSSSAGAGKQCLICHRNNSGNGWNSYGTALWYSRMNMGTNQAFASIENIDSDGDGYINLFEIENDLDPGWVKGFANTITYTEDYSIADQAPGVLSPDGGFSSDEEICFPAQIDFDIESSFYCYSP